LKNAGSSFGLGFDKKISVKFRNAFKRVASKIGNLESMDKFFSIDTDLGNVPEVANVRAPT
jgi:hypothetical protein